MSAMVEAGEQCESFLRRTVKDIGVSDVQTDEIWAFIQCKGKTRIRLGKGDDTGDVWCFTGVERNTKLLIAWHFGKRTPSSTQEFALKLAVATSGRFQLSTDGYGPYVPIMQQTFGQRIDFAQLIKTYGNSTETGTAARYSPGEVTSTHTVVVGRHAKRRLGLHVACRAQQFDNSNATQAIHAPDECVQQTT